MRRLAAACLLAALAATGCHLGPYAAVADRQAVGQSELNDQLTSLASNPDFVRTEGAKQIFCQGEGTYCSAFAASVLSNLIYLAELRQEAAHLGVRINSADRQLAAQQTVAALAANAQSPQQASSLVRTFQRLPASYRQVLVDVRALRTAVEAKLAGVDLSAAAIRRYYRSHLPSFSLTCVSQIQTDTAQAAQAVEAQLARGADFASLARSVSTDPGSAASGGALGCAGSAELAQTIPAFREALAPLAPGQWSQPLQLQGSWHIFKVTSRSPQPLSQVSDQVVQAILQPASNRLQAAFARFVASWHVTVNPQYGTWSTAGGQPEVVPPQAPPASLTGPLSVP
ncbi:MAG TPA: peptidyl-prolyl cis-trans isomerase [Acidimicrobiales bacterium]|nr:peptidyl-prolyl cis-trans isomerase [Acidimicrobiales bacterium]